MPPKSPNTPQTQKHHFPSLPDLSCISQLSVFSSVQWTDLLIKSWRWSQARPLLGVPRVPRCVACGSRSAAVQAQRAPVRRRQSVQDVRPWAGVGVGLLRHQHLKQRADLRQEGPAQWAVLLWSFTWEEEEERKVSLCWQLKTGFPLTRAIFEIVD